MAYFEKAYELKTFSFPVAYLSNLHFILGNESESKRYKQELEEKLVSDEHNLNLAMAMISASQSDFDQTLAWLERAQEQYDYTFAHMVNVDPIFKPLYEDPRFKEIRRKMQYYD